LIKLATEIFKLRTIPKGIPIATDFVRVVHGKRGSYYEFTAKHLESFRKNYSIPTNALWRRNSKHAYYIEYRTRDNVKIYYQLKTVSYADYKVGMYYISINDITRNLQEFFNWS